MFACLFAEYVFNLARISTLRRPTVNFPRIPPQFLASVKYGQCSIDICWSEAHQMRERSRKGKGWVRARRWRMKEAGWSRPQRLFREALQAQWVMERGRGEVRAGPRAVEKVEYQPEPRAGWLIFRSWWHRLWNSYVHMQNMYSWSKWIIYSSGYKLFT